MKVLSVEKSLSILPKHIGHGVVLVSYSCSNFSEALNIYKNSMVLPLLYDLDIIKEGELFYGSSYYLCVRYQNVVLNS